MSRGTTARRRHAVQRQKRWDVVVSSFACCAEGHDIMRGQWALWWPFPRDAMQRRFILCEAHALEQGYARPTPAAPAGPDIKRRQAGEE